MLRRSMGKIGKIIATLISGTLLLFSVVWINQLIGCGAETNYFILVAYLSLGVFSVIAAGFYLKRRGVDLGDAGADWLATAAVSGGMLILLWPLMLPILIWIETVFSRILTKSGIPTFDSQDDAGFPVNRPLSDEEKVEAMSKLIRKPK